MTTRKKKTVEDYVKASGRNVSPEAKAKRQQPSPSHTPESKPVRISTTVYLEEQFHIDIRSKLLREKPKRDYNQLVNDLLREWLEK